MPPSVLCIGESMALLVPAEPGPAAAARTWIRTVGGAESNVAIHLTRLGVPAGWVSAVGADALGEALLAEVAAHGVDVSGVRIDPDRPTGLYLKEPGERHSPVRYYRTGSAASALGPDLLDHLDFTGVALVHLSGITPALSESCADLVRALLRDDRDYRVSFDINHRPALAQHPGQLAELANEADIVLVGDDEAAGLWGVSTVDSIREVLPRPDTVVVKHGERGATANGVFWPALRVAVVEPVGAGDAFAAGYLAGVLRGADPVRCLRSGHLCAASALRTAEDIGPPLPDAVVAELLAADADGWAAARIP